jgi:5-methylcytosine-specific restriction endonuclease McrA
MKRTPREQYIYECNKTTMYRRDNWHCRCCNNSWSLTPHHIVFQSSGGSDDLDNLVTLCLKCHDDVHAGRIGLRYTIGNGVISQVEFVHKEGWMK